MPLNKHYGGHGEKVMKAMKKTYGAKKAKQVFYATENKQKEDHDFVEDMKKRKGKLRYG